jgi:TetR/AcrR family fatty acid metabolism transcriptional regulator
MIWFHLRYNDTHPEYARILFLECRFSREFYATPAYQLVRKYTGILAGILQKGVEEGLFRKDVDLRLVRDIILGTLTYETVTRLTLNEIEESVTDFEAIMTLIHAMIANGKENGKEKIQKSDSILLAAEKIFAEKGFSKAKISEIARLSGVADGTVYEYFANKEDLLLSIPEKRLEHYLDQLKELFIIKTPYRKLRRLIKYHFSFFLTEREFLKVFLLQIQLNKRFYTSKAFKMYNSYYRVIENVIEEGKSEGVFDPKVNPRVYRNMLLGTFNQVALRWLMLGESNEFDKMKEIDQITDLLSSAVLPADNQNL